MCERSYKAVFFDLDGTLLPIDMDAFLMHYFRGIGVYAAKHGYDPEVFIDALNKGVFAMLQEEGGRNDQRFWRTFCELTGKEQAQLETLLEDYYNNGFDELGSLITPAPEPAQVIDILREKGYRLYLTTMPLFPRIAVEKRLQWAGCDPQAFERITTYDNSTSTKPHLAYYRENVEAIGLNPEDILMVGNNMREDMSAMQLGLDGYLVTDWLLNPDNVSYDDIKHGTMAEFFEFVKALPECEASSERGTQPEREAQSERGTQPECEIPSERGTQPECEAHHENNAHPGNFSQADKAGER